jgi:hypothetical protein
MARVTAVFDDRAGRAGVVAELRRLGDGYRPIVVARSEEALAGARRTKCATSG